MTIFTTDELTLAQDTKIPAQLAAGDKGHTTPQAIGNLVGIARVGSSEFSYRIGTNYGTIDATITGALMSDGLSSYPNKIGVNNTKPVVEPGLGARTADSGYVAGAADLAINLGYDNVVNALAGVCISFHSIVESTATHAGIWGGSLHTIKSGSDYAGIYQGSNCEVGINCDYGGIFLSTGSRLLTGSSYPTDHGFRSLIFGGDNVEIGGRNSSAFACEALTMTGTYSAAFGVTGSSTISGSRVLAVGASLTLSSNYVLAVGNDLTVAGARVLAVGDGHTVASGVDYSSAQGYRCAPPFVAAHVHSGRQRGGTVGNNQALDWTASQETTDTTVTRLSASGSANFPTQPASSIVNGTVWVTGVSDAGACSSYRIDVTSERVGTGTPTLRANTTTMLYNGLSIVTAPTMNATTGGVYRVQVVGLAGTNIRWDARFTGQQIVYA